MATIALRPFGPIHRYRGSVTISVDQPTRGERVVVLSGTLDEAGYVLHIEAADIPVPTERVEVDEYGPFSVVQEQQVPIRNGMLRIEEGTCEEGLIEGSQGRDPLHIYFTNGFYDDSGDDFESPGPGHGPPPLRRRAP